VPVVCPVSGEPRAHQNNADESPNGQFVVTTGLGGKSCQADQSHGFAEDEDGRSPALPGTASCVGDSVTYGLLSQFSKLPHILEAMLDPTRKAVWLTRERPPSQTYTALLRYKYVISKYDFNGLIVGWFCRQ
jgi:hypothetical protein